MNSKYDLWGIFKNIITFNSIKATVRYVGVEIDTYKSLKGVIVTHEPDAHVSLLFFADIYTKNIFFIYYLLMLIVNVYNCRCSVLCKCRITLHSSGFKKKTKTNKDWSWPKAVLAGLLRRNGGTGNPAAISGAGLVFAAFSSSNPLI